MGTLDLRPLSVGELLDRTFSLYRRNFLLFFGISAIPHLLVLALQLTQLAVPASRFPFAPDLSGQFQRGVPSFSAEALATWGAFFVVSIIVAVIAYLFSQGGTVFAVAELYLGRTTTIGESLGRVRGELVSLFFVVVFNLLVIGVSAFFLIIPAIYMACRLCVCIPAALLENLGPVDSLQRSFSLTRDNAGRAFLILLLYVVILYASIFLFTLPFGIAIQFARHDPAMIRMWTALMQVGGFFSNVLITPVLTIASAIFYFDLRIRKEALDLQLMMNPLNTGAPAPSTATTLLS
jgi:hypothetical protein